jgi:response regulator RpfG family c-di-GMP phosphodiesterase/putative methionine-R-sulfoxide reductase with GAF domain
VETETLKILAIDDIPDNLISLKAVIRDAFRDAKIFTASNGREGIELARREEPTVILLDIVMPGMDGYEVARIMKADEQLKHIPLIFLTALKTDKKSRIKALEIGAEAFLAKPIDETELTAQVRAMARIHTAMDRDKQDKLELADLVKERTKTIEIELEQRRKAEQEASQALAKLKHNQLALLLLMEEMKDEIDARKQAEDNLKGRLTELGILAEFSQALSHLMTPEQIGQKIIDLATQKLNWHHIAIRQYNPEKNTLRLLAFSQPGLDDENKQRSITEHLDSVIPNSESGMSGWVLKNKQLVRLGDVSQDEHYLETYPGIRSGLYVPILTSERAIGVISVESEQPEAFSPADERTVTTLAAQAAIALENSRLYIQTTHRLKNIESLRQIDRAISVSFDMKSTLAIITETAQNQLNVSAVNILLYNQHSQTLDYAYGQGFRSPAVRKMHLHLREGPAGQVAMDRKILQIFDLKGVNAGKLPANLASEDFVSYVGVALQARSKVNGVLEIYNRTELKPEGDWYDFLEAFAHQASIAIDNAKLFDDLQNLNMQISLAYDTTIESWASTLEMRDKTSLGHAQRVTSICMQMASGLGLDPESVSSIRHGALLHDIGMLGVPESILFKPGELNPQEREVVRQHPVFAYNLLSSISGWRQAIDIPYCHHERWDGSGYPQGLKKEVIPLAARICAVVDVYDTLLMERPFRAAWESARAIQYINDGAGSQFDPEIVRIFLAMLREE